MYTFPELLKKIREEGDLTQEEMAKALDVSTVLVSMVETGQKEASKAFVIKLAEKMDVRPSSIMPFVLDESLAKPQKISGVEKALIDVGEKLQTYLIKTKAKKLKKYA
jgi:transcriptional regulator with XRE-family HTH domain